MGKIQLAVALSLLAVLAAPIGASAQTLSHPSSAAPIIFTEDDNEGDGEDQEDGAQFETNHDGESVTDDTVFGNGDGIQDDMVPLPPVVIAQVGSNYDGANRPLVPGEANFRVKDGQPAPIRVDQVHASPKTPADAFAEASYIALGALGLGAVSLGAVAGVRSYRLRRSGKADYFYES